MLEPAADGHSVRNQRGHLPEQEEKGALGELGAVHRRYDLAGHLHSDKIVRIAGAFDVEICRRRCRFI